MDLTFFKIFILTLLLTAALGAWFIRATANRREAERRDPLPGRAAPAFRSSRTGARHDQ